MNKIALPVLLQNQYARSLRIFRIIFDNLCLGNAFDDFADQQVVIGKLIITMRRYLNLSLFNQFANLLKGWAHRK